MGVLEAVTEEELQQLVESFVPADVNFDGFITPEELPSFLVMHFPNVQGATIDRVRNILLAGAVERNPNQGNRLDLREFLMIFGWESGDIDNVNRPTPKAGPLQKMASFARRSGKEAPPGYKPGPPPVASSSSPSAPCKTTQSAESRTLAKKSIVGSAVL